jgi:hypothetical protein
LIGFSCFQITIVIHYLFWASCLGRIRYDLHRNKIKLEYLPFLL